MKKIVLSILGIFALAACNEDVYQDIDTQNNGLEAANTASDDSGVNAPFTEVNIYYSPWNIDSISIPVKYTIENSTNVTPSGRLIFRVTPYVGLAYYDGVNNNNYYGTLLNLANYPNLYANGYKIGNFIPAQPIILDGTGAPGTEIVEIESINNHCPVIQTMNPINNPNNEYFDVSPIIGVSTLEESLLASHGKVFFFYWEAIDPTTNVVVNSHFVTPFCYNYPPAKWASASIAVNVPSVGPTIPLFYNIVSDDTTQNSDEVVFNQDDILNVYPYYTPFLYGAYYYDVITKVDKDGMYLDISIR